MNSFICITKARERCRKIVSQEEYTKQQSEQANSPWWNNPLYLKKKKEWQARTALSFTSSLHNQGPAQKWGTYLGRSWLLLGLWCTIMPCKWGNFIEFYRLSGIYFPQYYSCRLCVCGGFFADGGWNLSLWLLSLLLFSRITGQVRDTLWPKCQFQFHLHCLVFKTDD